MAPPATSYACDDPWPRWAFVALCFSHAAGVCDPPAPLPFFSPLTPPPHPTPIQTLQTPEILLHQFWNKPANAKNVRRGKKNWLKYSDISTRFYHTLAEVVRVWNIRLVFLFFLFWVTFWFPLNLFCYFVDCLWFNCEKAQKNKSENYNTVLLWPPSIKPWCSARR